MLKNLNKYNNQKADQFPLMRSDGFNIVNDLSTCHSSIASQSIINRNQPKIVIADE